MIYHVTPSYPPQLGGLEKVVQNLAVTQSKFGFETAVITSNQGKKLEKIIDIIPVARLRSFAFASTTFMPALPIHLMRVKPTDSVHLHITQAYTPEVVWVVSKLKKYKYIAHIHIDARAQGWAGFLLKYYKLWVLAHVLRSAEYVVVFTEDQRRAVNRKYNVHLDNIRIIPNGVEALFYSNEPRSISGRPKLLFVGRLGYQKNLPLLFNALDGISDQFETNIVGDGELRETLAKLVTELGLKNVMFAGRADGEKLRDCYASADIFVLSSEQEGMPLVLLEAMAMGLPIVATDVIGSRDLVIDGKNGLLVPYGDPQAFRAGLLRIATDHKLYQNLHKTGRHMANRFSWEDIAQRFINLYSERI